MNGNALAIAGVVLIPLIIGLVQAIKRFDPKDQVRGFVWFYLSLFLGILGSGVSYVITSGVPNDLSGWAACVVLGLSFGLAAGKAYDETLKPDPA